MIPDRDVFIVFLGTDAGFFTGIKDMDCVDAERNDAKQIKMEMKG